MRAFDEEVRASGRGAHSVVVPKTVVAALASRRVLVRIGAEAFETTLGTYGGRTYLGLRKSLMTTLGLRAGDPVHVELEPGTPAEETQPEPSPLTCPELDEALAGDPPLLQAWRRLSETHRGEYGRWISGGAEADVRRTRVARVRHGLVPEGPA